MKQIVVFILALSVLSGVIVAQEGEAAPALPELTSLADDAARLIQNNVPPRMAGNSGVFLFRGITLNGSPTPLGELIDSLVLSRALPLRIRNLAFLGPENPPGAMPDAEDAMVFGLSGEIFRVGEELVISLRLFRQPNFEVIGAVERILPLNRDLLGLLGSGGGMAGAGDFYEPNNDPGSATPYEVGEMLSDLTLSGGGDEDWFILDLNYVETGEDMVYLNLGTQGNLDTVMSLYGPDDPGFYIVENDDAEDSNARIQILIEQPGYYYAVVRGYDNETQGAYTLYGSLETMAPEEGEPNNTRERAEIFPLQQRSMARRLFPGGDLDWYRIDLSNLSLDQDEVAVIETTSSMDTYLELYRGDEFINSDDDGGTDGNARLEFRPEPGLDVYYVMVKGYDTETTGDYVLQFSRRTVQMDEYEPDNSLSEAKPIGVDGQRQSHNLELPDEIDWFRFELSPGRNVTVETFGGTDTFIYLYDVQGNVMAESDDDGSDYNGRISRFLPEGVYYFSVEPYSRDGAVSYEVSVTP